MLNGAMLLWFILTGASVAFVAIDIRNTPESSVLKWGFVLLTAYTGPIGSFLYVLGCREPLPGLHERYVAQRWRQVLGSTMHCVAGDGVGILAGAVIGSFLMLSRPADVAVEYLLGFGFGWTIFQALFMRGMSGGSYRRALVLTFLPEFLSMNVLMAGMMPTDALARRAFGAEMNPQTAGFWFVMSMGLLVGFIVAYPMNWWLVSSGLKHGMMTVRPAETHRHGSSGLGGPKSETYSSDRAREAEGAMDGLKKHRGGAPSRALISAVAVLSIALFGLAFWGTLSLSGD